MQRRAHVRARAWTAGASRTWAFEGVEGGEGTPARGDARAGARAGKARRLIRWRARALRVCRMSAVCADRKLLPSRHPPRGDASLPLGPSTPACRTNFLHRCRSAAAARGRPSMQSLVKAAAARRTLPRARQAVVHTRTPRELFLFTTVSLPCWCYRVGESSRMATLGKRLIGLRVVDVCTVSWSGPRLCARPSSSHRGSGARRASFRAGVRHAPLGYRPALFVASRLGRSVPAPRC